MAVLVAAAGGCKSKVASVGDEIAAPVGPPQIPAGFRLEVVVDGRPGDAIDEARLKATPPDFTRGSGHAWRLSTFFDDRFFRSKAVLHAVDAIGDGIRLATPGKRKDRMEPVLVLNQRGEALITVMADQERTDVAHGRGGSRKRGGDNQVLRLEGVRQLELEIVAERKRDRRAKGERPGGPRKAGEQGDKRGRGRAGASAGPDGRGRAERGGRGDKRGRGSEGGTREGSLVESKYPVKILGGEGETGLSTKDLNDVEPFVIEGPGGQGKVQFGWDLRAVAAKVGGADARVTRLVDERGNEFTIDPDEWADTGLVPTLRVNQRGMWRFHWVDQSRNRVRGKDVRSLVEIHFEPAG